MTSRILHLKDVAEACGVTVETVRDWIDRGLRAFTLGQAKQYTPRDYLIREEWLLEFLDAQSTVKPKRTPAQAVEAEKPKPTPKSPKKAVRPTGRGLGPCPV